jgi:hypothetical protein
MAVPEPVTLAATAVSVANGVRSLFGGRSKESSVHQGWRVEGTLTRDGLTGTNTAFDQLGNTWGGAIEAPTYYAPIFREYLGDSTEAIPVSLTVSASEGYNAGVVRQLREAFDQVWKASTPVSRPAAPAPILPPSTAPVSLFDPDPTSDSMPAPIVAQPAREATRGGLFDWLLLPSPIVQQPAANNMPTPSPIVPTAMQSAALRNPSQPAATVAPGMSSMLPLLAIAVLGALAIKAS